MLAHAQCTACTHTWSQAKIAEGMAKAMTLRDEKAQKKFAKEEAKKEELVAEAAPEPEPEPEPIAEAAPTLKPAEMAARVKELRALLPKADLKACKMALEAVGFDLEAAKAALEAEKAEEWAAQEAADAVRSAYTVRMQG